MFKSVVRLRQCSFLFKSLPRINPAVSLKTFERSFSDDASAGIEAPPKKRPNPFAKTTTTTTSLQQDDDNVKAEPEVDREKRLKVLQLEADIAHQEGRRVPNMEFFQEHHWEHLLTLPSRSARTKYYAFLWQIQMKKEGEKRKKAQRAEGTEKRVAEMRKEREENTHIIYGLAHTSLFLRIYDSTINHWQNNRLTRAMQFNPKMVLDCSYDAHMNNREAGYAAKQLMLCFAENRAHDEPFDLHYCNAQLEGNCMQSLKRYIPTMLNADFPMNVHKQCFTELFPKEQLVYLTPHCRQDLVEFNPDDIYIVGAMVDTMNNEPLSLAKAKRLGLRMARLPLDRYLQWGSGSGKSLTLNQMINIMLDLKQTNDWETALRHVPRRKVVDMAREVEQNRNSLGRQANRLNVRIDQLLEQPFDEDRPRKQNNFKYNNDSRQSFEFDDEDRPRKQNKFKYDNDSRQSFKFDGDRRQMAPQKLRSRKEGLEFDLDNWAAGKKKSSRNS